MRWTDANIYKNGQETKNAAKKSKSNLALDVNSAKGGSLDGIEVSDAFASQEIEIVSTFLEQVLGIVINNELARVFIGHESKLLSNEAEFHIWLESGNGNQQNPTQDLWRRIVLTLCISHTERQDVHDRQTYPLDIHPGRVDPGIIEKIGGSCPWLRPNVRPEHA